MWERVTEGTTGQAAEEPLDAESAVADSQGETGSLGPWWEELNSGNNDASLEEYPQAPEENAA